jgi:DNA-binding transcriptional MerR regulator
MDSKHGPGDEPVYSIGAVAKIVDVPVATIRAWEERYAVVRPTRSEGSQRLYSRRQIEQLKYIKSQIEAGASAADAHRLLSKELGAGRVPPAPAADRQEEPKPLILLAERDSYAAELAEYLLRTEGYAVSIATDAQQTRLLFAERSPDLVVIDLLISGGAGFRLTSELKASASTQILAVASIDAADEAMALGASAFLRKPLEPLALVSTVRDLLGTSALARPPKRPVSH